MSDVVRISGIALLGAVGSVVLKEKHKGAALACAAVTVLTLLLFSFENSLAEAASQIIDVCRQSNFYDYAKVLFRALGIAYIAGLTASLCREAGEEIIGGAVEAFAKCELIALSIPLIGDLMVLAKELINK